MAFNVAPIETIFRSVTFIDPFLNVHDLCGPRGSRNAISKTS